MRKGVRNERSTKQKNQIVFLKDDSSDLKNTSDFLDAQITKVMEFEKFKASMILRMSNITRFYKDIIQIKINQGNDLMAIRTNFIKLNKMTDKVSSISKNYSLRWGGIMYMF